MAGGQAQSESGVTAANQSDNSFTVRKCSTPADFAACVDLQKQVWQFADIDIVPTRMFSVADKIGGQVIGCFEGTSLVGFALSIPGARGGHSYLHSHMLAVREEFRNKGIGKMLKLAQRDDAISRGFELMEWTFDPLEIKNAFLNISRLGAISRRYNINQYGSSSSPLQGGLPTDRLVAEWWLNSDRVIKILGGAGRPPFISTSVVEVPAMVYQWKASLDERGRAQEVQLRNREMFLTSFGQGQVVLGFDRDSQGNGKFLLGNWDEAHSYNH